MTTPTSPGVTGLSHVAIAVPDIEAAAALLEQRFGLRAGPVQENATQKVRLRYIELGNTRIELIAPLGLDAPLHKFLEKNPSGGLHHVAFTVPDVADALAAVAAAGVRQAGVTSRNLHGNKIAFLNPKDVLGALVELEQS